MSEVKLILPDSLQARFRFLTDREEFARMTTSERFAAVLAAGMDAMEAAIVVTRNEDGRVAGYRRESPVYLRNDVELGSWNDK